MVRWLWQLPQHLLALALITVYRKRAAVEAYRGSTVYWILGGGFGVSLGQYIFLDVCRKTSKSLPHEYGHSRQSLLLGPLYLIVVGLPSITMNILSRLRVLRADRYYKRWPESWADRLGGVTR